MRLFLAVFCLAKNFLKFMGSCWRSGIRPEEFFLPKLKVPQTNIYERSQTMYNRLRIKRAVRL